MRGDERERERALPRCPRRRRCRVVVLSTVSQSTEKATSKSNCRAAGCCAHSSPIRHSLSLSLLSLSPAADLYSTTCILSTRVSGGERIFHGGIAGTKTLLVREYTRGQKGYIRRASMRSLALYMRGRGALCARSLSLSFSPFIWLSYLKRAKGRRVLAYLSHSLALRMYNIGQPWKSVAGIY